MVRKSTQTRTLLINTTESAPRQLFAISIVFALVGAVAIGVFSAATGAEMSLITGIVFAYGFGCIPGVVIAFLYFRQLRPTTENTSPGLDAAG